ncbi:Protein TolB [Chlamydia avium]|uniref:Protein TolB homolog n=2 Tax=Chlamydia avium TaxID=1457141 RepID=W8K169_9CHLA|nr:Tol-Pal system protein TolB [Chlamydia avium]AHK63612.1 Protein TolB [Chlamydia avium 10DC88]EPP36190.1 WD40-like Beta Propeller Repeat family protein [Chlamydia psittaci 10_743_SC13]EPP38579.1 WD40-like Beta Propeller Repeat family protein [Chlamydia avium]VVT43198.1 Protein TolB [Chlamydia avium]
MFLRVLISTFLIFGWRPSYARDLEVIVRSEATTFPLHVELHIRSTDAKQQQYLHALSNVFINDLALGDILQPSFVKPGAASTSLRIAIIDHYPELIFSLAKANQEYQPIHSIILTEDTQKNRQKIHESADKLHYVLTNIPGISSGKIVFSLCKPTQDQELKHGELWTVDHDGENLRPLTQENSLSITPHWTNIGENTTYFYVSYKLGIPKIFLGSLGESSGRKILNLPGNQFMPAFSPRKKLLAFISDSCGNPDLFLQSFSLVTGAMGKPRRILNETYGTQGNPSFSPDGSKLVFVSNKDGRPRLYTLQIEPEIQTPKLLTKKYRNSSCPVWSPDGTKIAFCSVIKGVRQICIYDLSTGRDSQLTTTPINKESPSWAMDSQHLVYSAGNAEESDIYLLSLITQKTKKIVIGPGEKRFPSWGAPKITK